MRRVLIHSGKLHYDLLAELEKRDDASSFALVRLEQFYPLPVTEFNAVLARYPGAQLVWVQDEPENQGAWPFINQELVKYLQGRTVYVVSRPAAASPAAGSTKVSAAQQAALIAALNLAEGVSGGTSELDLGPVAVQGKRALLLAGTNVVSCCARHDPA